LNNNKINITASIVTYNTDVNLLTRLISCFDFKIFNKIYIIDNSKENTLSFLGDSSNIIYINNPHNPGYGAAHNIAIRDSISSNSKYHFIVNPDVFFDPEIINIMINYCEKNGNIGMMMPRVLNNDNSIQYLPKFLPTIFSIIFRKIKFLNKIIFPHYEMRNINQDLIYNTPVLSGCFTLLNMSAIKKVGMYDDAFFMYFEDWDLSRRVHEYYSTIYFPKVSIYHEYYSGANKNIKLFLVYLSSMIYYFNKWGWIFDRKRVLFNNNLLKRIQLNEN
jgi:GT2 family glycosyltransferase